MSIEKQPALPHRAADVDAAVAHLSYEEARAELMQIVGALEQGNIPLEQSLSMWERGEALARRCEAWLDGARKRLAAAKTVPNKENPVSESNTQASEQMTPPKQSTPSSPHLQSVQHGQQEASTAQALPNERSTERESGDQE